MIDYVYGGEFLNVTSNKGATPYISPSNQPMTGALGYDSATQHMKVYDGNGWQALGGGTAMVNLSDAAIDTLKWAQKKMMEERELQRLCDKSPAIKDIVGEMRTSMDNYINKIEMVKALLQEEVKV